MGKLKQQELNLDDEGIKFNIIDAIEVAELRGVEYREPRLLLDIAVRMSAEMLIKKKASIRMADPSIIPDVRKLLLTDLNALGSQHRKYAVCDSSSSNLVFRYINLNK